MVGMGLKPLFVCMSGVQHIWGQKFVDSHFFLDNCLRNYCYRRYNHHWFIDLFGLEIERSVP